MFKSLISMAAIFNWFKALNSFAFLIVVISLLIGISFSIEQLALIVGDKTFVAETVRFVSMLRGNSSQVEDQGKVFVYFLWFVAVVLSPFFETLIFQWAPIRFIKINFQIGRAKTIFVSAFMFGLAHLINPVASPLYILATFCAGLVLAFGFMARDEGRGAALWLVAIAHSANNFLSLCFVTAN